MIKRLSLLLVSCLIILSGIHVEARPGPHRRFDRTSCAVADMASSSCSKVPRGGGGAKGLDLTKVEVTKGKVSLGRVLEFHKIMWLPFSLYMMQTSDEASRRSALLTGLFGGYGIIWVIKSYTFWDKNFYNDPSLFLSGPIDFIFCNLSLATYLLYPYVAAHNTAPISPIDTVVASLLFTVGIFFHYAADAQKFFSLKYKGGLVTEGLFSRCRNPSYFGEWLIWIAFTIIAGYNQKLLLIPNLWFALITISGAFKKEKSLSRYPEFIDWKKKTWLLFPKPF